MPDEDPGVIPEEVQRLLSEELERNLITGLSGWIDDTRDVAGNGYTRSPEYNDWPKRHLIDCWNCGEEIWTTYDDYTCAKCEVGYDAHFKPNPTASWTRHWWEYETHRTGMLYVYMDRYHVRPRDIIDHQTQHVPCPA